MHRQQPALHGVEQVPWAVRGRDSNASASAANAFAWWCRLVYAVKVGDPTEAKVGSWEMPVEVSPRFFVQTTPSCDGKAIVQASAVPKRYRERFWFRAPPAGTGPIVFRVLIKRALAVRLELLPT